MSTKVKLTPKQKQQLLKIKRTHKSNLIRDRAHAVLLRNQGLTLKNTAQAVLRSECFVKQSIKRFKQGELEQTALSGNNFKLSEEKRKEVIRMIQTKCPKELKGFKYHTQFWSTDILKTFIKKKYKLEFKTDRSYHNLFKQAGFSFKKPIAKDFRQNPEKIKKFKGALKKSSTITRIRMSW
jgi:transposase